MKRGIVHLSIVALSFLVLCVYTILAESQTKNSASASSSSSSSASLHPLPDHDHHPTAQAPASQRRPPREGNTGKPSRPPREAKTTKPSPLPSPPPQAVKTDKPSPPPQLPLKNKDSNYAPKKIGVLFAGVAGVLQVCVVGFLVFKRRQYMKVVDRYHSFNE